MKEYKTTAQQIWDYMDHAGGATTEMCENVLNLSHQTASAAISQMARPKDPKKKPNVQGTGEKMETRSGRKAEIYRAIPGRRP